MNTTTPARLRLFRVRYAWTRYKRTFAAHTVWAAQSVEHCKADFARRNPHVISFTVESEVQS